jgi:hypothetical protein
MACNEFLRDVLMHNCLPNYLKESQRTAPLSVRKVPWRIIRICPFTRFRFSLPRGEAGLKRLDPSGKAEKGSVCKIVQIGSVKNWTIRYPTKLFSRKAASVILITLR